ncbi:hypothetical protein BH20ACT4_BH20ACT4_11720 [soil metagenome]
MRLGADAVDALERGAERERAAVADLPADGAYGGVRRYLDEWTRWNHVRTLTAVAGSAVLALSLRTG